MTAPCDSRRGPVHTVFLEHSLPIHLHVICSDVFAVVTESVLTKTLPAGRVGDVCCRLGLYILHGVGGCVRPPRSLLSVGSAVGSGGREVGCGIRLPTLWSALIQTTTLSDFD